MYIRLYMLMWVWVLLFIFGVLFIGNDVLIIGIILVGIGLIGGLYTYLLAQGINLKVEIKHKLWHILLWIDNSINHKYFEKLFGLQSTDIGYFIWKHTSRAYCNFIFDRDYWDTDREVSIISIEDLEWEGMEEIDRGPE